VFLSAWRKLLGLKLLKKNRANRENKMASPYPKVPKRSRPKNLNLLTIRLPIPALVSIMHRVSGAFLFLLLPGLLWLLAQSLASAESYGANRVASPDCETDLLVGDMGLFAPCLCWHSPFGA
jgi:hypothetical protein